MRKIGWVLAVPLLLAGCPGDRADEVGTAPPMVDTGPTAGSPAEGALTAMVVLLGPQGDTIGQATLREDAAGGGVLVSLDARNLPPGERAVHFHETGQCDAPDFESAGDHFAPMGRAHGFDHPDGPHAGDMRNLQVGPDGSIRTEFLNERVTLREGEQNSLLAGDGTSLVIHADADDYVSQPGGDAGDRIACGVVRRG